MSSNRSSVTEQFGQMPVAKVIGDVTDALNRGHAVLTSPTGSGKTTLTPLSLLESPALSISKIIMLEPRRIAARAAAVRMSNMVSAKVGAYVGYRTRDESRVSGTTKIEVITEGILIRLLQKDPELSGCNLIIFDEFHERSLQADLCLALCLDLCQIRDDLRLLVMSATLQTNEICKLLGNAPHIRATGRSYPVDIEYLPPVDERTPIAKQTIRGIKQGWLNTSGDILAFLPGAGEIHYCQQILQQELPESTILPLYGNLNHSQQDRVFHRKGEQRRIILATPVAETSITIEHISTVVDSGFCRRQIHDHSSGLSRLSTFRISKSSAAQRAGRAGRLGPGHCIRLWSKKADYGLLEQTPPEIINGDLSSLVLELALWGVTDPAQLSWLDPPRQSAWDKTVQLLEELMLLDNKGQITHHGRNVASLPVHPRLGIILARATELNLCWTGCLVTAVLTDRDIFTGKSESTDIEERVEVLARSANKQSQLPPYVDKTLCRRLLFYANQWFHTLSSTTNKSVTPSGIGNLLSFGFPDRIAQRRHNSNYRYQLASGRGAELPPADTLSGSQYLVAPQLDMRQGDGRIFLAAKLTIQDIEQHHSHLLRKKESITWNGLQKRVVAQQNCYLGKITLASIPMTDPDQDLVNAIFMKGVQQGGPELLRSLLDHGALELKNRIAFLHGQQAEEWPNVDDGTLVADLNWLTPYCQHMRNLNQLKGLQFKNILFSMLNWKQQQQLEKLAPSHLHVPSGSSVKIDYSNTTQPVLAVRMQELYGLTETPAICNNQIPILLHLLSPARRPIQVTSDLRSFWLNTYPEVRKELAGRYPKHYWPEDPRTAKATNRTKRFM